MLLDTRHRVPTILYVSILIQPEGWMLRTNRSTGSSTYNVFQSSSSPKAGCYSYLDSYTELLLSFNPHPARRLDATLARLVIVLFFCVSILIQPEGWMLRGKRRTRLIRSRFNPHPARRLDATHGAPRPYSIGMFQSSSSPKAGCYDIGGNTIAAGLVSILIQPEGWMLPTTLVLSTPAILFQSSSSPKAGCYRAGKGKGILANRFNPHPARRLDATLNHPCA